MKIATPLFRPEVRDTDTEKYHKKPSVTHDGHQDVFMDSRDMKHDYSTIYRDQEKS